MNKSLLSILLSFTLLLCFAQSKSMAQTIRYVKQNATGSGTSWDDASGNFQAMVNASQIGDQVWVAAGEYKSGSGQSFSMKEDVKIYGGFVGTENALSERNLRLAANRSMLRGNGGSVIRNFNNNLTKAALLDGFTITAGRATYGAGIYNVFSSPTISNCVFYNNISTTGGGMYNSDGASIVINCIFQENGGTFGGAIAFTRDNGLYINCVVTGNFGSRGGTFYIIDASSPSFINCTIVNSTLIADGQDIYIETNSHPTFKNSIIYKKSIYISDSENSSKSLENCLDGVEPAFFKPSDPAGVDGVFGTADDGLTLMALSPAVDAGNNDFFPTEMKKDIKGDGRVKGSRIDIGAYESDLICNQATGIILYVNASVASSGNGNSWSQAFKYLNEAIDAAKSCSIVQEIYVAKGTYQPLLNESFVMQEGIKIYGGFPNTGTPAMEDRNWRTNETILQGNGSRVMANYKNGLTLSAVLDGFTLTGGQSVYFGGGMYNEDVSPTLRNLVFRNNSATQYGGGIYNLRSSPSLNNVSMTANTAEHGGAMINISSNPELTNLLIANNTASVAGGGIHNNNSSPILTNVTITGNTATTRGGGMDNLNSGAQPVIRNSIIYGNTAGTENNIFNNDATPKYAYSLVEGSGESGSWNATFGTDQGNNQDADPLFTNSSTSDYSIKPASKARNQGNNAFYPDAAGTKDLAGYERIFQNIIDLGAYENQVLIISTRYVKAGGTGNGYSWETASGNFQAMINESASGNEVWVAAGTYQPSGSFSMKEGVKIYGGFNGTETLLSQRNWGNNQTVLLGNGTSVFRNSNNGLTNAAVLDGFIITGGYTNYAGGGMLNSYVSPSISNVVFTGNKAGTYGGGLCNITSFTKLSNVVFYNNEATGINDVYIMGYGGAIYNDYASSTSISQTTFLNNKAAASSAIFNSSGGLLELKNSVFYVTGGFSVIEGFSGAQYALSDNLVQKSPSGTNTYAFSADPFVDSANPAGADGKWMTADDGLQLNPCSPAVNAGNNENIPTGITFDISGNPRRFGDGIVDMGAYEYQSVLTNNGADMLALNTQSAVSNIFANNKNLIASSAETCRTILSIFPNGTSPVSGIVTVTAWIDSKVNDANGAPYVQRHYDISPTSLTATASLTLYYTQAEFDAFNLKVGTSQKIPAGSDDASGKSNLRVFQYHGASSDGSGSPSSYTGSITAIDPTDTDIVWNSILARWEVSFSVIGFSGFFLGTASLPLPVKLVSFIGKLNAENVVKLEWRVTEQVDIEKYVVESSTDGRQFSEAGVVNANELTETVYTFSDNSGLISPKQVIYYRLRIIEMDGKVEFSRIIAVQFQSAWATTLYPLPGKTTVWLKWTGQDLTNKKAQIVDIKGQVLQDIFIDKSPLAIDVSTFDPGIYFIRMENGRSIKLVKE